MRTDLPAGAGTGLGLAQTYGFVSQSGGAITIASTPDVGTSVELLLPRAVAMLNETQPPARLQAVGAGQGETILFAEDDALLRETVTMALENQGYAVIGAVDGDAALAILQQGGKVDLLFTDVMMPGGLNGVGLAQAARALRPTLKIMFASGYTDRQVLAAWPEDLDLLAKPYSLEALATRIAACLRGAALETR